MGSSSVEPASPQEHTHPILKITKLINSKRDLDDVCMIVKHGSLHILDVDVCVLHHKEQGGNVIQWKFKPPGRDGQCIVLNFDDKICTVDDILFSNVNRAVCIQNFAHGWLNLLFNVILPFITTHYHSSITHIELEDCAYSPQTKRGWKTSLINILNQRPLFYEVWGFEYNDGFREVAKKESETPTMVSLGDGSLLSLKEYVNGITNPDPGQVKVLWEWATKNDITLKAKRRWQNVTTQIPSVITFSLKDDP